MVIFKILGIWGNLGGNSLGILLELSMIVYIFKSQLASYIFKVFLGILWEFYEYSCEFLVDFFWELLIFKSQLVSCILFKLCVRMDGTQVLLLWWFTAGNESGNHKWAWVCKHGFLFIFSEKSHFHIFESLADMIWNENLKVVCILFRKLFHLMWEKKIYWSRKTFANSLPPSVSILQTFWDN